MAKKNSGTKKSNQISDKPKKRKNALTKFFGFDTVDNVDETLSKAKNAAKENSVDGYHEKTIIPSTDGFDVVTGENIENIPRTESKMSYEKPKENLWVRGNNDKNKPVPFWEKTFIPKPIEADVTIACIDVTASIEQVKSAIEASLKYYNTKFYKFIFFSSSIYSTEIYTKMLFPKEKIIENIVVQKEIAQKLPNDKVVFFDAVDEAFNIIREKDYLEVRKIKVNSVEYALKNFKYLFVVSGIEKGSSITKSELQEVLAKARDKETDVHLVLTNPEKIIEIAPLGFRSIKSR